MRWTLLLVMLAGCVPFIDERKYDNDPSLPMAVVELSSFAVDRRDGFSLVLAATSKITLAQARKRLMVLASPTQEKIALSDAKEGLPITIKKGPKSNTLQISSKQKQMSSAIYGLYVHDHKSDQFELVYIFITKKSPPKLIRHDLGDDEAPVISNRRLSFSFTFDQPISLLDDQAISLTSSEAGAQVPAIESLTVTEDKKAVFIRLSKDDFFQAGMKYSFVFNGGLVSALGEPIVIDPLKFMATDEEQSFDALMPMVISASHDSAEITSKLSQAHRSDLFIAALHGAFDCVGHPCLLGQESLYLSAGESSGHKDRLFFTGLGQGTTYNFMVRSEDRQGQILVASGTFKTGEPEPFRISEIMINPKVRAGEKKASGEFIEIANVTDVDQRLGPIHLSIEDAKTGKIDDCDLGSAADVVVAKKGHFLIASSSFLPSSYGLGEDILLIRLKQKTLCGGLAINKRKIIRLHRGDGNFVDRFSGHLWGTLPGQSVQRIYLAGLDEARNYCYSKATGPTPGALNGPCDH